MRLLVVGGGGREHAIAHYLSRSRFRPQIYAANGNAGTAKLATNVGLPASDIDELLNFAKSKDISLTVVGPEMPLTDGIVDAFRREGLSIVGPVAAAAKLEGSKAFSKRFMTDHSIPTAAYRSFARSEYDAALAFLRDTGAPVVVKASGLAGGKGAIVCHSLAEAEASLKSMMRGTAFGDAADEVVVEEFMEGEEASLFALCDGTNYIVLPTAQDHKRVGNDDTGPNTGGMGAYAPAPVMTDALIRKACTTIVEPTLEGMRQLGSPYTGFLYVGLMIDREANMRVVEFNCRMGDPETQAVLPLVKTDALDLFQACVDGRLDTLELEVSSAAAATVVMASGGYPARYTKGHRITGLRPGGNGGLEYGSAGDPTESTSTYVYHAGTRRAPDGQIVTNGGRVLAVTGTGPDLAAALDAAYKRVDTIDFEGAHYRTDIGKLGLERLAMVSRA